MLLGTECSSVCSTWNDTAKTDDLAMVVGNGGLVTVNDPISIPDEHSPKPHR